jgi:hypothetical protein
VSGLDPDVRELLERWAAEPARPTSELTAEIVRADDLAVLDLQRAADTLHSIDEVEIVGPGGSWPCGCIDRDQARCRRCSSYTAAAS